MLIVPLVNLKGQFDRIICDPPFLSNDCQTKGERQNLVHSSRVTDPLAALTVRWLSRDPPNAPAGANDNFRLVVCTGERMEKTIRKLYAKSQLHTTDYEVKHAKGLSNEFRCFANFECDAWKFLSENNE